MAEAHDADTSTANGQQCEYCNNEYDTEHGLRMHYHKQHKDEIKTETRCTWCGGPVEVSQWEVDDRHYCSRDCSRAWNYFIRHGKIRPTAGERESTRPGYYRLIALTVRGRDGHSCMRCGADDTADGRRMHVHHITPEDDAEDPHRFTNLLTVCGACHRTLEILDPADQLAECDLESRDELELDAERREQYETMMERWHERREAPEPWVGMFAEAQQLINSREDNDD